MSLDLFNALYADTVFTYNQAFTPNGQTWLVPNTVLTARTAKITVQVRLLIVRSSENVRIVRPFFDERPERPERLQTNDLPVRPARLATVATSSVGSTGFVRWV